MAPSAFPAVKWYESGNRICGIGTSGKFSPVVFGTIQAPLKTVQWKILSSAKQAWI